MRARWLSCLHCRLTARRSWVRFPHGALLALGGRSSPECTVLRWVISRAFLCGVCMFSPLRTPTETHANRTIMSVPDRDGRFTWSPGAEEGRPGKKAEQEFTATSGLRVSWSPPYI